MRGVSHRRPPSWLASSHLLAVALVITLATLAQPSSSSSTTTTPPTDTSYDGYIDTYASPENNSVSIIYDAKDKRITSSYVKTRGRDHVATVFSTDGTKCLVDVSDDEDVISSIESTNEKKSVDDGTLEGFDVVIHLAPDVARSDLFENHRDDDDSEYDGSLNLCLVVRLLEPDATDGSSSGAPPPLELIARFNLILNEATMRRRPVEYVGFDVPLPVRRDTSFEVSRVVDGDSINLHAIVNVTKKDDVKLKARALTVTETKIAKNVATVTIARMGGEASAYDVTGSLNLTLACGDNDIYKAIDNNNNNEQQGGTLSIVIQIEVFEYDDEQRHRTKKKKEMVSIGYINVSLTLQIMMTSDGTSYGAVKIIAERDKVVSTIPASTTTPPHVVRKKIVTPVIVDYPIVACQCDNTNDCRRSFLSRENNVVRICLALPSSSSDVVIETVDYLKLSQLNWQQGRTPISFGGSVDSSTTVETGGGGGSSVVVITTTAVARFFRNRDPIPIGVAGSVIFGFKDRSDRRRRERDRRRGRELERNRYNRDHQMSKNVFTVIIPVERDDTIDETDPTAIDDARSTSGSKNGGGSSSSHFSDVVILAAKVVFGLATSGLILLAFATMTKKTKKTKDDIKCEEYLC